MKTLRQRISACEWPTVLESLRAEGVAVLPALLDARQRAGLRANYGERERFRSRIVMQRHNYGRGEYQYFSHPLPPIVQTLREMLYVRLAPLANAWESEPGERQVFPADHKQFLAQCHASGQRRPTPLLLRYGPGDYNCLHQDLYGEVYFPLQVVFLLSEPVKDFGGGEFVLVEQRPRMQSRARVVPLRAGDAAVFAVNNRPVQGKRGRYRVRMRHGVSEIRRGERVTLGVIFHDAA